MFGSAVKNLKRSNRAYRSATLRGAVGGGVKPAFVVVEPRGGR